MSSSVDVDSLAQGVLAGQRRWLAKAITLVESSRLSDTAPAQALLERLLPRSGQARRVGITGTPGVGKSTLIEALGLFLVERGLKVAVLAVDPSSTKSGGSILGDKTRMEDLARQDAAYIRPSPSGGALGGVARKTREAMLVCEAAGFDVILIETVGVGQSETEVASMVDTFVLLIQPASGDALQGVKRGVLESADIVVVNKADGALLAGARQTQRAYRQGLSLLAPQLAGWSVPVRLTSALKRDGLDTLWADVDRHVDHLKTTGAFETRRGEQARAWMWRVIDHELGRRFRMHREVKDALQSIEDAVKHGERPATDAAVALLDRFFGARAEGGAT